VFTFDLYQGYIHKNGTDLHYLNVGRITTVIGVALSIGAAYLALQFNNLFDFLQLVFSFVNPPLFATFLMGMFWKRATGHGAFWGLLSGTFGAGLTQALTTAEGKGGWLGNLHTFSSQMAENFWISIISWSVCLLVTIAVSLMTKAQAPETLTGLVHGLSELPDERGVPWHERPAMIAVAVAMVLLALNWWFR
jgi:SSS family solute:Na+ symporter